MQKTRAVKKQTMLKQTDWITTNGEKQCKNKHLENEKKKRTNTNKYEKYYVQSENKYKINNHLYLCTL